MSARASRLWSDLSELARRKSTPVSAEFERPPEIASPPSAWERSRDPSLIVEGGHRKVIHHYQELLRTQTSASSTERTAWESKIAREEAALRQMTQNTVDLAA